ncbi:pectin acetylesterase 5-like isoform X2 [Papaver somniferum]|uniref:pectin acetylesterase 5-like isoform X2 n=1 Tax=Papaver somniferum TaxID=3469 RepID=UPI000E6FCD6E|nr:pectin acetylesterase 5-like isoform X2 [Papaver somniferum]
MSLSSSMEKCFLWSKWGKKEWVIISVIGFTVLSLAIILILHSSLFSSKKDIVTDTDQNKDRVPETDHVPNENQITTPLVNDESLVDLILLQNAQQKGAVCLDGSSPGYHLSKGFDSGSQNWLLFIEGGGWCDTLESCASRAETSLGSSKFMDLKVSFNGILSNNKSQNPDFFNWNKVMMRYCDGASFAGNQSESESSTGLFFRGQLIWDAVMEELLSLGLANAQQKMLPKEVNVKCLSDAGFFLDEKDVSGKRTMRSFYHAVSNLQGVTKSLPKDCISKMKSSTVQCLFPQNFVKYIKTPVFLLNPSYDYWQIENILVPSTSDNGWVKCKSNLNDCSPNQTKILHGFRMSMLKELNHVQHSRNMGMFINACYSHCQTSTTKTWHSVDSPRINNKTIAEAVGDWYFNRKAVKEIDGPYPSNPTC